MRVGVIGGGSIGARHAQNAKALGHDVAVCDTRVEPTPHFRHVDDMITLYQPNAVLVCTPADTHAEVACQLRAEGYRGPLFVEKPLALSIEECAVFKEWPSPVTMVGYNLRFHPFIEFVRPLYPTGGHFIVECDNRKYGNDYFELSHEIDLALYMGAKSQVEDVVSVASAVAIDLGDWGIDLDGRKDQYFRSWEFRTPSGDFDAAFFDPATVGVEMYRAELAHFLACVEQNKPTITPFADGSRVVEVCEAAMECAQKEPA